MPDNVILSTSEFEKMTDRILDQDEEIKELRKANKFLNDQIKEYTEEFTGAQDEK